MHKLPLQFSTKDILFSVELLLEIPSYQIEIIAK